VREIPSLTGKHETREAIIASIGREREEGSFQEDPLSPPH